MPAHTRFRPHPATAPTPSGAAPKLAMEFRADINGLRAFAVIAVVLYHFGLGGFDGGFAGVDVFFVISGFLMTGIILSRLQQGNFSIAGFYVSRLRRILPALAALCLALLLAGYFWLIPSDYAMLGKHSAAAVAFVSNIVFKGEKGYFDAPSRDKWLLHTWSLSVEGQFYLLYPLVLLGAAKIHSLRRKKFPSDRRIVALLLALSLASFAVSVFTPAGKAAAVFFLLPGRIWEFMAGALVNVLSQRPRQPLRGSRGAEFLGMTLMVGSFFLFNSDTFWPGYACLMPVLGASLIILAAREKSPLTGNAVAQQLGKWSYSIYLWHWPVFVGLGYYGLQGFVPAAGGILCALMLGAASCRAIETPGRERLGRLALKPSLGALAVLVLLSGGTGAAVFCAHGLERRVSAEILDIDRAGAERYDPDKDCSYNTAKTVKKCVVGEGPDAVPARAVKIDFVLWGDSHAGTLAGAVGAASHRQGLMYSLGCPTIFGARLRTKGVSCDEFNLGVLGDLKALPKNIPVIVVDRYAYYLLGANEGLKRVPGIDYEDVPKAAVKQDESGIFKNKLADSLCRIAATRNLYAVQPIPEMGTDVPKVIARKLMTGREAGDVSIPLAEYRERNKVVLEALEDAHALCGVKLLDPVPYLCKQGRCHGSLDRRPLYFDDNHLNEWGNRFLVPMFAKIFP